MPAKYIRLRGVRVHNLKAIDLELRHGHLIAFCGVSGSGKSSLALDTLYAEGQRRYIDSLSAYTRQFLDRFSRPAADRIEGIPPAIAVTRGGTARSNRSTVGSATETNAYLRLLYAKIGTVICDRCQCVIKKESPASVAESLGELRNGTRFMVAFPKHMSGRGSIGETIRELRKAGFVRAVADGQIIHLASDEPTSTPTVDGPLDVLIDRLRAGDANNGRLRDSLEAAFENGDGRCVLFTEPQPGTDNDTRPHMVEIDGRKWLRTTYSATWRCDDCDREYPEPQPRLYDWNSPLGACGRCEGFGDVVNIDMDLVVPQKSKSIREGAIAPWNTPAYAHELRELLELADDYGLPVDVPFDELDDRHLALIQAGVPERNFGGLDGFFAWLEKRKYKMHIRVFLSRWRSYRSCPECRGSRLRPEALATRIAGRNIAQVSRDRIDRSLEFFRELQLSDWQSQVGKTMLDQVRSRLSFLCEVGLGYLSLDRALRTLSGGEAQRVALTSTLGSNLVDMLYVLDEPSVGLHPKDVDQLSQSIATLRDRGNTVVVVEHEENFIRQADQVIEIGPAAGDRGGEVVFQGTPAELEADGASLTGEFLTGRRGASLPTRRHPERGWIRLAGARGNNLKGITVEFPLGVLCLVTGVSGSGKSTLVQDTLYGALCRRKRKEAATPLPYDDVFGDGQIDDVMLIDQNPIGRSPRSNPVTYIKAFDQIRQVFAQTLDARTHNYAASHFSFNVDGGRCEVCKGDGSIEIDMQFLADVYMTCDACGGTRYRREILEVLYRGRSIADVLQMTVRQAFSFFRGQTKVQAKLKQLIDVGLEYLRLGQPANTLSSGEAQRLKLAAFMSGVGRKRTLFMLDEPTTGLHFADIVKLLDCFEALLSIGHSLVVVEHNMQLMKAADYLIDLGPGAGDDGGRVVAKGSPEQVANQDKSATGRYLAAALAKTNSDA